MTQSRIKWDEDEKRQLAEWCAKERLKNVRGNYEYLCKMLYV